MEISVRKINERMRNAQDSLAHETADVTGNRFKVSRIATSKGEIKAHRVSDGRWMTFAALEIDNVLFFPEEIGSK